MNDDRLLEQIDRALDWGLPVENATINRLARSQPQADRTYQQDLEQLVMAQLQDRAASPSHAKESKPMYAIGSQPALRPARSWALSLVALMLISFLLFNRGTSLQLPAMTQPIDPPITLVIAAQAIPAGTIITETMVATITVAPADFAKLQAVQPEHEFPADSSAVIGQTAAVDLNWFEPIDESQLGEPVEPCNRAAAHCPNLPEGYFTIGLPMPPDTLQGLRISDRVDVLAALDNQLRVVTADVLLADITPEMVILAAPSWQHSILMWLYHSDASYTLRLHTGEAVSAAVDTTPVEYTFIAPETLPDNYVFDLIVTLPAAQGYLLSDLPAAIDHIEFTGPDNRLTFWFKNLVVLSIVDGTTVTIRLPRTDATILDYLIHQDASLTFIPDAG